MIVAPDRKGKVGCVLARTIPAARISEGVWPDTRSSGG